MFDAIKTAEQVMQITPGHKRQKHRLDIEGASGPDKLPEDYEHGIDKESFDRSATEKSHRLLLTSEECKPTIKYGLDLILTIKAIIKYRSSTIGFKNENPRGSGRAHFWPELFLFSCPARYQTNIASSNVAISFIPPPA